MKEDIMRTDGRSTDRMSSKQLNALCPGSPPVQRPTRRQLEEWWKQMSPQQQQHELRSPSSEFHRLNGGAGTFKPRDSKGDDVVFKMPTRVYDGPVAGTGRPKQT
jgi:hypothetical protein